MTGPSVCMFSNLYPPVVSGSATQSSDLARELARRGCRVAVVTAQVAGTPLHSEVVDGVEVHRLPALHLPRLTIALNFPWLNCTFLPDNLRRIAALLERLRPDVLHVHNHMFDLALSAVLLRRRFRAPLVVTLHTMIRHARRLYNCLLVPADRILLRHLIVDRARQVICPDMNMKEYAARAFGRPAAAMIPYGITVSPEPDPALVDELRARHGLAGKRVILSIGHVHEIRNRKELVAAMATVVPAIPNAVLLIVGAVGTDVPGALARRLGLQQAVVFAGPAPHAHIPAYHALADLEAHWINQDAPEKTSLGVASLEAMGAGKVVLAAANPDTYGPGVLKDGENLVLVDPARTDRLAETIVGLLRDEGRRRAIGECARATIRAGFSWDVVCTRTLELYRALAREAP